MTEPFSYVLTDYPRVIEPAVAALEVSIDKGDGRRPLQLCRLDPVAVHLAVVAVPIAATHFFGDAVNMAACYYVLAYNEVGLLIAMFVRDDPDWIVDTTWDCDFNGTVPQLPSLRMVFKDRRSRDVFLYYLDQVKTGRITNASLAAALDGMAEDIRVIDVIPTSK